MAVNNTRMLAAALNKPSIRSFMRVQFEEGRGSPKNMKTLAKPGFNARAATNTRSGSPEPSAVCRAATR